jgi:hypothetical protein
MCGILLLALAGLKGKKADLANQENAVFQGRKPNGKHKKRHPFLHDLCQLKSYRYKTAVLALWYKLPFLPGFGTNDDSYGLIIYIFIKHKIGDRSPYHF